MDGRNSALYQKILGCLLGGLIGDAMGAPVEGWNYKDIIETFGEISDFNGEGTDDSFVKGLLCKALAENDGDITADEFAQAFLDSVSEKNGYDLLYIPVKNMYHKIQDGVCLPVDAGYGNMQSSSSAMAISPLGIVNACNPRQAAMEAYEAAGLIHSGPASFCRDAASAIAAAVAEAFRPGATVQSVLLASTAWLHKTSAQAMVAAIRHALDLADECRGYAEFREKYYLSGCLRPVLCDSRETVPCALALFGLAEGDPERSVLYGANFGRDADTIATMAGAIAGAFRGVGSFPPAWLEKISHADMEKQKDTAEKLMDVALNKAGRMKRAARSVDELARE